MYFDHKYRNMLCSLKTLLVWVDNVLHVTNVTGNGKYWGIFLMLFVSCAAVPYLYAPVLKLFSTSYIESMKRGARFWLILLRNVLKVVRR